MIIYKGQKILDKIFNQMGDILPPTLQKLLVWVTTSDLSKIINNDIFLVDKEMLKDLMKQAGTPLESGEPANLDLIIEDAIKKMETNEEK